MITNFLIYIPGLIRGFKPVFDKYFILNTIPVLDYMQLNSIIFLLVITLVNLYNNNLSILKKDYWNRKLIVRFLFISILLPISGILYLYLLTKYDSYKLITISIVSQIIVMLLFNLYLGIEKIDTYVLFGSFLIIIGIIIVFAPQILQKKNDTIIYKKIDTINT
jgi:uncharacterized membrane protein